MRNAGLLCAAVAAICLVGTNAGAELVSLWTFNEMEGNIALDSVGLNHGTITGAQRVAVPSGRALSFDGNGDFMDVPDASSLDITYKITVSAWVKIRKMPTDNACILLKYSMGDPPFALEFHRSDGTIGFVLFDGSYHFSGASRVLTTGTWYYIVGTYDGERISIYINGQLDNSMAYTGHFRTNSEPLVVGSGKKQAGRYFDGLIDEVAIYNHALSAQEVLQLYRKGPKSEFTVNVDIKPNACPNLVNPSSAELLRVAVLGTDKVRAESIDPTSIRLEGIAPIGYRYEDISRPESDNEDCVCDVHIPDGRRDLVLHFRKHEVIERLLDLQGDLKRGQVVTLKLMGNRYDGKTITGKDCLIIDGKTSR